MLVIQEGWLLFVSSWTQRRNGKKLYLVISIAPLPLSSFLSYLVIGLKRRGGDKRWRKEPTKYQRPPTVAHYVWGQKEGKWGPKKQK